MDLHLMSIRILLAADFENRRPKFVCYFRHGQNGKSSPRSDGLEAVQKRGVSERLGW
jgi:hypothetical protein